MNDECLVVCWSEGCKEDGQDGCWPIRSGAPKSHGETKGRYIETSDMFNASGLAY